MITKEQAVNLPHNSYLHYGRCTRTIGPKGGVREKIERYRKVSMTKTWVTRPNEWQFTVRWGIHKTTSLVNHSDADLFHVESDCPLLRTDGEVS